jgi:hypothetical protein
MSVKIKIKIKEPSKRLASCLYVYTTISRAKQYVNKHTIDLLVLFSFINKDWFEVINNVDQSRRICQKLINNDNLNIKEEKSLKKFIKTIKYKKIKVDEIYYDKIKEYQKKMLPKIQEILKDVFTDTKASIDIFFIYQPLVKTIKGSAFNNGIVFSVENNYTLKNDFSGLFSLITHELIHVICSNNKEYKQFYKKLNEDYIFNETFTKTLENICMYKLKTNKKKYQYYRYDGPIRNNKACKVEDELRKLYDCWEKKKNKKSFINYIEQNINNIKELLK